MEANKDVSNNQNEVDNTATTNLRQGGAEMSFDDDTCVPLFLIKPDEARRIQKALGLSDDEVSSIIANVSAGFHNRTLLNR